MLNFFKDKICSKYTPKRTKLHHLKKSFLWEHAPETFEQSEWLRHAANFPI